MKVPKRSGYAGSRVKNGLAKYPGRMFYSRCMSAKPTYIDKNELKKKMDMKRKLRAKSAAFRNFGKKLF